MAVYLAKSKMIIFAPIFNSNITMNLEEQLRGRSNNQCELCISATDLSVYEIPPQDSSNAANSILLCGKCLAQVEKKEVLDSNHWNCLTVCMWSEVPAVQVMSWRMLNRLRQESWATDSLDMMYLDDAQLAWAKAAGDHENDSNVDLHKDCNGQVLQAGDSVVLIKSLDVKGSSLNAKMGTVVKNIKLVEDNSGQIEGKIEGQTIIILTKFVRKQH
jgi:protein PhnA